MQSIDIKSRTKEMFKKNIEVALKEILKEYDVAQRTNCDYIRLYLNNRYSIIIKMLPTYDPNSHTARMYSFCDPGILGEERMFYLGDVMVSDYTMKPDYLDVTVGFMVSYIMMAYKTLESINQNMNKNMTIQWNLNEDVDITDRLYSVGVDIEEKEMNPKDFAVWIGIICDKLNNAHNNKLYLNLDYELEDTPFTRFRTTITIEELANGRIAYNIEYKIPSLHNESREYIGDIRLYSIDHMTTELEKIVRWWFDLRSAALPGEKFRYEIDVLRPEFWT